MHGAIGRWRMATTRAIVTLALKRLFIYVGMFCIGVLRRENSPMAVNMMSGDRS